MAFDERRASCGTNLGLGLSEIRLSPAAILAEIHEQIATHHLSSAAGLIATELDRAGSNHYRCPVPGATRAYRIPA